MDEFKKYEVIKALVDPQTGIKIGLPLHGAVQSVT